MFLVGTYPSGRSLVGSRPYPLLIGQTGLAKKKHSSLFGLVVSDKEKSFFFKLAPGLNVIKRFTVK